MMSIIFHSLWTTLTLSGLTALISALLSLVIVKFIIRYAHTNSVSLFENSARMVFLTPPIMTTTVALSLMKCIGTYTFGYGTVLLTHILVFIPFCSPPLIAFYQRYNVSTHRLYVQSLRLHPVKEFFLAEWPLIKHHLAHAIPHVFAMTSLSFSLVLLLGGGYVETITLTLYESLENARLDLTFLILVILQSGLSFAILRIYQAKPAATALTAIHNYVSPSATATLITSAISMTLTMPFIMMSWESLTHDTIPNTIIDGAVNTLTFSVLCTIFMMAVSVALISTLPQRSLKMLYAIADFTNSMPKLFYVILCFIAQTLWLPSSKVISITLITFVFSLGYGGYIMRALKPDHDLFYKHYGLYCKGLRLTPWKHIVVLWPYIQSVVGRKSVELICFISGNLTTYLFLAHPEKPYLTTVIYDAILRHDLQSAHSGSSILLLLLWSLSALPLLKRYSFNMIKASKHAVSS